MLKRFSIHERDKEPVGYFEYDTEVDKCRIIIRKDKKPSEMPAYLLLLAKQGRYEADDYIARKFISERMVPPERQNIGMILKNLGLKYYDPIRILEIDKGICCMDNFLVELID